MGDWSRERRVKKLPVSLSLPASEIVRFPWLLAIPVFSPGYFLGQIQRMIMGCG